QLEIESLRSTVIVARSTLGEHELSSAPTHVWQSIRSELGLSADLMPPTGEPTVRQARAEEAAIAEPVQLDAVRERRAGIRRFIAPVLASAAAAAIVTAAVVSWSAGAPRDPGVTLAAAQLDALPAWAGSAGEAIITERSDGERVIRIALDAEVDDEFVREVWLLTENIDGLISLGLLDGPTGEFVIPASVDLTRYSIVDISAEPLDGDPTHSGDSIVRGALDV
ncbi:MAG: anti-sigma factor, partial [Microcella sp.]|nr:anti-sigma factor [Microcella sp.]